MKTQKITLCFEEGSLLHSDKDLWYRGTDNVLTMEQKLKVINLIFSDQKKLSCSQLSSEEVIQKELEKSLLALEPFIVNFSITQWFPRGKNEENDNNYHLWSADITIKAPIEMIRKFEDDLVKNPVFIKMFGQDNDEEICFTSEFMEMETVRQLFNELEPEFKFIYHEKR